MASKASAVWTGSLKEGKGTISTATGVLKDANYSFATRFEGATSGTTPEELIAAAHASCFSMALGAQLGGAGLTPNKHRNPGGRDPGQGGWRLCDYEDRADHHGQRSRRHQGSFRQGGCRRQGRLPDLEAVCEQHGGHAGREVGVVGALGATSSMHLHHPLPRLRRCESAAGSFRMLFSICAWQARLSTGEPGLTTVSGSARRGAAMKKYKFKATIQPGMRRRRRCHLSLRRRAGVRHKGPGPRKSDPRRGALHRFAHQVRRNRAHAGRAQRRSRADWQRARRHHRRRGLEG